MSKKSKSEHFGVFRYRIESGAWRRGGARLTSQDARSSRLPSATINSRNSPRLRCGVTFVANSASLVSATAVPDQLVVQVGHYFRSGQEKPDRLCTARSNHCVRQVVEQPVARKQAQDRPHGNAQRLAGVLAENFGLLEESRKSVLRRVLEDARDHRDAQESAVRQLHVYRRSPLNESQRPFQRLASFSQESSRSRMWQASNGSTSS